MLFTSGNCSESPLLLLLLLLSFDRITHWQLIYTLPFKIHVESIETTETTWERRMVCAKKKGSEMHLWQSTVISGHDVLWLSNQWAWPFGIAIKLQLRKVLYICTFNHLIKQNNSSSLFCLSCLLLNGMASLFLLDHIIKCTKHLLWSIFPGAATWKTDIFDSQQSWQVQ